MNKTATIIQNHFEQFLIRRHRGLVTVISLSDCIIAGIGDRAFLKVAFLEDRITIIARLPIPPSKPEKMVADNYQHKLKPQYGRVYCIKLSKNRKRGNTKANDLLNGITAIRGQIGPATFGKDRSDRQISFDYSQPQSLHAAEYYANKIISVIRRKVRISGDDVFLKDPADETDIIDLVTREWKLNKPRFTRK